MSDAVTRPHGQLQPGLQIEESDRSVLKLLSEDTRCLESKSVPIEPQCLIQVVHAKRNHGDACSHTLTMHAAR